MNGANNNGIDKKECVEFGVLLIGIAMVAYLYLEDIRIIYACLTLTIVVLVFPLLLYPAAYAWFRLGRLLNVVGPVVILTIVFVVVVTPVGLIRTLFRKDSLRKHEFGKRGATAMIERPRRFIADDFRKMY